MLCFFFLYYMIELKNTRVVVGSDVHELCLHAVAHVKSLDKLVDSLFVHLLVGAGESLQCLVGMRISLAAQYSLDGFSHHCPCIVEVGGNLLFVEDEFAQAL
jgi:hypothetical protein